LHPARLARNSSRHRDNDVAHKKTTPTPERKLIMATRTVLRSSKGKKLYAVRDKGGKFKDIQTYERAHRADLAHKSKAEKVAAKKKAAAKKKPAKKS
jgi:hypothetical protein